MSENQSSSALDSDGSDSEKGPGIGIEPLTEVLVAIDEKFARGDEPSTDPRVVEASNLDGVKYQKGVDCLRLLDRLRPGRSTEFNRGAGRDDSSWRHGDPTRIGRFQIRKKLGHGGFGVVYLAYDAQLRRQVALKVPHPRTILTSELRERFQREAAAAAALDHPNVVPVFDSGEAGPVCYIAAAYCPGISLAAWLRGQQEPVPARSAAALIAQVADGVQHAHERGILHRDLKPGNVLLTPLRAGKPVEDSPSLELSTILSIDALEFLPRITDFGMAKRVGEWELDGSINDDPAAPLTKTGAVMGTPSYMAPEQAAGRTKDVSPATDVHGLGIILYELITGQSPFLAESTFDTLRRVQQDEPLAPSKLRPKLPKDLETICLKCLQKEPKRRYQTARELADDLRRFLEGKTILARSVGPVERAWRWSLREPLVAGLVASLMVVLVSAFLGLSWLFMDARRQAKLASQGETNAITARLAEMQARAKAEEHLGQIKALMDHVTTITRSISYSDPAQRRLRQSLLEDLLKFHEVFIIEKGDDPSILHESAKTYQSVANIRVELGQLDRAEEAYLRASNLYKRINELDSKTKEYRISRAWFQFWNGYFLARRRGLKEEAIRSYDSGIAILREYLAETPDSQEARRALGILLMNISGIHFQKGLRDQAEAGYRESYRYLNEVAVAQPRNYGANEDVAIVLDSLAESLMDKKYRVAAEARLPLTLATGVASTQNLATTTAIRVQGLDQQAYDSVNQAMAIMRRLVREGKDVTPHLYTMTRIRNRLSAFRLRAGDRKESNRLLHDSIRSMKPIVETHPEAVDYRLILAEASGNLGYDLPVDKRDEAILHLREALFHIDKLVSKFPDTQEYKVRQANFTNFLVDRLSPDRRSEALVVLENLVKAQPKNSLALNNLAWFLAWRPDSNTGDYQRALDLAKRSVEAAPRAGVYDCLNTLGFVQYRVGDLEGARQSIERCLKERKDPIPEDHLFLGMVQAKQGHFELAREHYSQAIALMKNQSPSPEWSLLEAEAKSMIEPGSRK